MFTLIRGAEVYSPEYLGRKDVLMALDRIVEIGDHLEYLNLPSLQLVDADGRLLFPGLVDGHVHITGGGGEGGFATRTPEVDVSQLLENGITTVVGVLGTDGVTRSLENLYAKAGSLDYQGVTAYILTGSYQVPVMTLTGSVQRDMVLIDKVIGAGEIAVSDHRSFQPALEELARIAAEARVGGMLSGKAGIVNLHMGDHKDGMDMVFKLVRDSSIPRAQFLPTHLNRNRQLFQQAIAYGKEGGYVDLTAGFEPEGPHDKCLSAYEALAKLLEAGVSEEHITMTSDGNGSMPVFDAAGKLVRMDAVSCCVLLEDIKKAVFRQGIPLEKALKTVTSNPARMMKLADKGCLRPGGSADAVLADSDLNIRMVWSKGVRRVVHV